MNVDLSPANYISSKGVGEGCGYCQTFWFGINKQVLLSTLTISIVMISLLHSLEIVSKEIVSFAQSLIKEDPNAKAKYFSFVFFFLNKILALWISILTAEVFLIVWIYGAMEMVNCWKILRFVSDSFFFLPNSLILFFLRELKTEKEKDTDTFRLKFYFWGLRLSCSGKYFL